MRICHLAVLLRGNCRAVASMRTTFGGECVAQRADERNIRREVSTRVKICGGQQGSLPVVLRSNGSIYRLVTPDGFRLLGKASKGSSLCR